MICPPPVALPIVTLPVVPPVPSPAPSTGIVMSTPVPEPAASLITKVVSLCVLPIAPLKVNDPPSADSPV